MASHSIAEQIIQDIVSVIRGVEGVKHVARKLPTRDEIEDIPNTQLPYVAVTNDLPRPQSWGSDVNRYNRRVQSDLPLEVILYVQRTDQALALILSLADDIWKAVLADPERGGLAVATRVEPGEVGHFAPLIAARIGITVTYFHNGGSI